MVFGLLEDDGSVTRGFAPHLQDIILRCGGENVFMVTHRIMTELSPICRLDEELKIKQMKLRDFMALFGIDSMQVRHPHGGMKRNILTCFVLK